MCQTVGEGGMGSEHTAFLCLQGKKACSQQQEIAPIPKLTGLDDHLVAEVGEKRIKLGSGSPEGC